VPGAPHAAFVLPGWQFVPSQHPWRLPPLTQEEAVQVGQGPPVVEEHT
jgi:hypothetical protein